MVRVAEYDYNIFTVYMGKCFVVVPCTKSYGGEWTKKIWVHQGQVLIASKSEEFGNFHGGGVG